MPYEDPQSYGDASQGMYASATAAGEWTVHTDVTPVPEHVFDACETSDGLFLVGSSASVAEAVIWRFDGTTWTVEYTHTGGSGFDRVYAIGLVGDTLMALRYDAGPNADVLVRASDGTWAVSGTLPGIYDALPVTFDINEVPFGLALNTEGRLHTWQGVPKIIVRSADEATRTSLQSRFTDGARDIIVTSAHLWVLGLGIVVRYDRTGLRVVVGSYDDVHVCSLAVDEDAGYLWFGTSDSRVLRAPIPAP